MIVYRGFLCLILVLHHRQIACYIFPYLLSKFSLTVFYCENIHVSLNSFDSSTCHGQANSPHLHTLVHILFTFQKILATWFERSGHPFSGGHSLGQPSIDRLNLSVVIVVFPTPLCPLVWLVATSTLSQAPSSTAEPEEGVGSLHCNHSNTFQRCNLQSLWVFQFSMAALFLRGYVYPRNKHTAKYLRCYSVKYMLTVYKTSWALNKSGRLHIMLWTSLKNWAKGIGEEVSFSFSFRKGLSY